MGPVIEAPGGCICLCVSCVLWLSRLAYRKHSRHLWEQKCFKHFLERNSSSGILCRYLQCWRRKFHIERIPCLCRLRVIEWERTLSIRDAFSLPFHFRPSRTNGIRPDKLGRARTEQHSQPPPVCKDFRATFNLANYSNLCVLLLLFSVCGLILLYQLPPICRISTSLWKEFYGKTSKWIMFCWWQWWSTAFIQWAM